MFHQSHNLPLNLRLLSKLHHLQLLFGHRLQHGPVHVLHLQQNRPALVGGADHHTTAAVQGRSSPWRNMEIAYQLKEKNISATNVWNFLIVCVVICIFLKLYLYRISGIKRNNTWEAWEQTNGISKTRVKTRPMYVNVYYMREAVACREFRRIGSPHVPYFPHDFKGKRSSHGFHQWSSPNNRHGATAVPASLNPSLPHKSQHQVPVASASDWENCSCSWQTLGDGGDASCGWLCLLPRTLLLPNWASNMAVENWWKPPLDGGLKKGTSNTPTS